MPFMQLYVTDYLADTSHLSTLEHGAYLLLIMSYWQRGAALPDDDTKLARISRMHLREWKRIRPQILEFFRVTSDGWTHKRVEQELAHVRAKSLKAQKGGLASVQAKLNARSTNVERVSNHTDTDTDTEKRVPIEKSIGVVPPASDPVKAIFDCGRNLLTAAGMKPAQAGSLVGKWRRDFGDGVVMEVLFDPRTAQASNAVEWITKALAARGNARRIANGDASIEATAPAL